MQLVIRAETLLLLVFLFFFLFKFRFLYFSGLFFSFFQLFLSSSNSFFLSTFSSELFFSPTLPLLFLLLQIFFSVSKRLAVVVEKAGDAFNFIFVLQLFRGREILPFSFLLFTVFLFYVFLFKILTTVCNICPRCFQGVFEI